MKNKITGIGLEKLGMKKADGFYVTTDNGDTFTLCYGGTAVRHFGRNFCPGEMENAVRAYMKHLRYEN